MKPKRSSTKFAFNVGYVLIGTAVISIIIGFFVGAINANNIIELIWALLLSAAAFLGINLSRVTIENVAAIKKEDGPSLRE